MNWMVGWLVGWPSLETGINFVVCAFEKELGLENDFVVFDVLSSCCTYCMITVHRFPFLMALFLSVDVVVVVVD
jgi:hypothetical protein